MLVLLHGLGVGQRYFGPLAAELGDVVRPEVREAIPVHELAERWAVALTEPALLVANSMGCQVAVELAVRYADRVRSLVLVGPGDPRARTLARNVARLLLDSWYEPPALTALVVRDYLRNGPVATVRQARHALGHRIEELLPLVEQPAVVVRGANDPICPADWGRDAAALLPHGRLVTIAGAGHAAHFSHPREVARVVCEVRGGVAAAR